MALGGQPLPAPEAAGPLVLAPGQRADLIVDVVSGEGEEAFLVSREREHSDALAAFPVRGRSSEARLPVPPPLPPNSVPALGDLAHARRETLRMDGGTMGRIRQAMLGGRTVGVRELAAQGKVWAFNGLAEMPDVPFFTADRGETVRLTMINDTAENRAVVDRHGGTSRRVHLRSSAAHTPLRLPWITRSNHGVYPRAARAEDTERDTDSDADERRGSQQRQRLHGQRPQPHQAHEREKRTRVDRGARPRRQRGQRDDEGTDHDPGSLNEDDFQKVEDLSEGVSGRSVSNRRATG